MSKGSGARSFPPGHVITEAEIKEITDEGEQRQARGNEQSREISQAEVDKLIAQYKNNAESMRKSQAHPHVPGIWDGVVKDLEALGK